MSMYTNPVDKNSRVFDVMRVWCLAVHVFNVFSSWWATIYPSNQHSWLHFLGIVSCFFFFFFNRYSVQAWWNQTWQTHSKQSVKQLRPHRSRSQRTSLWKPQIIISTFICRLKFSRGAADWSWSYDMFDQLLELMVAAVGFPRKITSCFAWFPLFMQG